MLKTPDKFHLRLKTPAKQSHFDPHKLTANLNNNEYEKYEGKSTKRKIK